MKRAIHRISQYASGAGCVVNAHRSYLRFRNKRVFLNCFKGVASFRLPFTAAALRRFPGVVANLLNGQGASDFPPRDESIGDSASMQAGQNMMFLGAGMMATAPSDRGSCVHSAQQRSLPLLKGETHSEASSCDAFGKRSIYDLRLLPRRAVGRQDCRMRIFAVIGILLLGMFTFVNFQSGSVASSMRAATSNGVYKYFTNTKPTVHRKWLRVAPQGAVASTRDDSGLETPLSFGGPPPKAKTQKQ